ncbi:MAG: hypothetical protein ACYC7E_12115 [Armatimonadota bacterium]
MNITRYRCERLGRSMLAVLLCLLSPGLARAASQEERQQAVVKDFLRHYLRQEMPLAKGYLPTSKQAAFGPYPFSKPPVLSQPKVDKRQAVVEFTAPVIDAAFLPKGGVLLYRDHGTWKVRQVIFYRKIPALFRLPKESRTTEDKRQEPLVEKVAAHFLQAWKTGNTGEMFTNWYAWMERRDAPIAGLRFTACSMELAPTPWGEHCARYCAKLAYKWGLLSYSFELRGRVFLIKEGENWKVRGNVLVYDF